MDLSRRKDDRRHRRPWELLLLLLALLMSLACVFFSTWLALRFRPEVLASANMLPKSQADYHRLPGEEIPFAPLDSAVGAEAATDVARLALTPDAGPTPVGIVLLPPTPTVTSTPTPRPVATSAPTPLASPTPTPTQLPTPTSPPPPTATLTAPPTSTATTTRVPTVTPAPTQTLAPTPTLVPTGTPVPTLSATPTHTPVPTPTQVPTNTPAPTSTPTPTPVRPIVQAIVPNTMVNTDTVTVTITGLNFQTGCSASLGSVPLLVSSCTPTTTVQASVPAGILAGYYGLTVTNTDRLSGAMTNAYTATNPIPLVTGITPALSVITTTDLAVTISGDYFRDTGAPGALRADIGGTSLATVAYVSPTTLTATVPISWLGAYTLTVTNPGPTDPTGTLANALTVYTYTTTCEPRPTCEDAVGQPDGASIDITATTMITIDFGPGNGISDGPGYDMIVYEWANPDIDPGPGVLRGILLDYVTIELVEEVSGNAYTVFEWDGDNPGDVAGTNIDRYATDGVPYPGERENEPIPYYDLYPGRPPVPDNNSGIAIDIGVAAHGSLPPGALFRWVRISLPQNPNPAPTDTADIDVIDAIVRLN